MKAVHLVEVSKTKDGNLLPRSGFSICGEFAPSIVTTHLDQTTCKRCQRGTDAQRVSTQNLRLPESAHFGPTMWSDLDWNKP